MKQWSGIFPALLTPFHSNGTINEESLRNLVRRLLYQGVNGFYVGGSTAECFLMTDKERLRVLEIVVEETGEKGTIIFHVGNISTQSAGCLAREAQSMGADAISSVPPFYYPFTKEEIQNHYRLVMESSQLPMLIYSMPSFSGVTLNQVDIKKIASYGEVMGIKYTSGDFFTMERIRNSNPEWKIYNGYDEMLTAGLSMGANGGIGSTYNIMAKEYIRLYQLVSQNRMEEARTVQAEVNHIIELLAPNGLFASLKYILTLSGIDMGSCREPFLPLNEIKKSRVENIYRLISNM